MWRALLSFVPGVGPAVSTAVSIASNRFAQLAAVALAAFIWGHVRADRSAALREAARERAVLVERLKETERQRAEADKIVAETAGDLATLQERDKINQERIAEYERNPPKPGDACALDDDFRRRLRDINSGR